METNNVKELLSLGAKPASSPAQLANKKCDVIFTMVGFPSDLEEVLFG